MGTRNYDLGVLPLKNNGNRNYDLAVLHLKNNGNLNYDLGVSHRKNKGKSELRPWGFASEKTMDHNRAKQKNPQRKLKKKK